MDPWAPVGGQKGAGSQGSGLPSGQSSSQERRKREKGLPGQRLSLGQPLLGSIREGSPRSLCHPDWVRKTALASRNDMCTVQVTERPPSHCILSHSVYQSQPQTWPPLSSGRLCVQPQPRGVPTRLYSQLPIMATSWPQLPVLDQSYWTLRPGPGDSDIC